MKSFNEMNEDHDVSGSAWPIELLGMTVDELLDRLSKIDEVAYSELEAIIGRRVNDIISAVKMDNSTGSVVPTFNELDNEQQLADIEDKLRSGTLPPDTRRFLMQKAQELKGTQYPNIDTFNFNG